MYTNPDLPSYYHPELVSMLPTLTKMADITEDLRGVKHRYLHKETKEPKDAYASRLERATFENRAIPAIWRLVGLINRVDVEQAPLSMEQLWFNIDFQGSSFESFTAEADFLALRDGYCCILVDHTILASEQTPSNLLEQNTLEELRPYLTLLERCKVINWKIDATQLFEMIVLEEDVAVDDGLYGLKIQRQYRVLRPGSFQVFEIVHDSQGRATSELIDSGETTQGRIPIVYYPAYPSHLMRAEPPLKSLFDLNIKLFRKESESDEVTRKCNLPVPVRKGVRADENGDMPGLVIGPNSYIDLPDEGDFYFAEPTGSAIDSTERKIDSIKKDMDNIAMAFSAGAAGNKTATEVGMVQASQLASLKTFVAEKQSAMNEIAKHWVAYTGEDEEFIASINTNELVTKLQPAEAQVLESLANQGFIDTRTLLLELQKGKVLSPAVDVDAILEMVEVSNEQNDNILEIEG